MTAVRRLCGLWVWALMAGAGCTPTGAPVADEGKVIPGCRILQNGLPIRPSGASLPPGDPGLRITFIKLDTEDAGKEMLASITDEEEGTFELVGPEGKGIPPGKYRVALFLGPEGGEDQLKGKYARENSPIEVEVVEGKDVVIDLADYEQGSGGGKKK